jgi:hypothetical protein
MGGCCSNAGLSKEVIENEGERKRLQGAEQGGGSRSLEDGPAGSSGSFSRSGSRATVHRQEHFWSEVEQHLDEVQTKGHSLQWMNDILRKTYPLFVKALQKQIQPILQEELTAKAATVGQISSVTVQRFHFGDTPPQIGPLDVKKRPVIHGCGEAVDIIMKVEWETACNIDLQVKTSLKTFTMGITKFRFDGEVTLLLCPIVDSLPCVQSVQVYMVSMPTLDFEISSSALEALPAAIRAASVGFIRNNASKAFREMLVLPNRMIIPAPVVNLFGGKLKMLAGSEVADSTSLKFPKPEFAMELGVTEARNLTAKDTSMMTGKQSSDPYAKIRVGNREHETPVIHKKLNPVWGLSGWNDFLIFNARQNIQVEVYDEDAFGDDLIGRSSQISIADVLGGSDDKRGWFDIWEVDMKKPDSQVAAGQIRMDYKLFSLSNQPETVRNPPKKTAKGRSFLQMQVRCLRGLPEGLARGAKIRIKYGPDPSQTILSKGAKYVESKNSSLLCEATSQRLAEYMIIDCQEDEAKVAEVSGLRIETIRGILKQKPSFTTRWFQGYNIFLEDAPNTKMEIELIPNGSKVPIARLRDPIKLGDLLEEKDMTQETRLLLETIDNGGHASKSSFANGVTSMLGVKPFRPNTSNNNKANKASAVLGTGMLQGYQGWRKSRQLNVW